MTLSDFKALLLAADPALSKYSGATNGNYTTWRPGTFDGMDGDGKTIEPLTRIYVDRFTKSDTDPIVLAIDATLKGSDEIALNEHISDYESTTWYIHHSWTCEVI